MEDVEKSLFSGAKYLMRSKALLKGWVPTGSPPKDLFDSNHLLAVNKLSDSEEAAVEVEFQGFVLEYQRVYEARLNQE
jgi:hypothetical protein